MIVCLAALFWPANGFAKCVTGTPINYDDVDAVLYTVRYSTVQGSRQGLNGYRPEQLAQSSLWALWGLDGDTGEYAQFSLPGEVGTFHISATLKDVVKVLRDDGFYELSAPLANVLDGTHSVLTVRRCSVVKRIMISNGDLSFTDSATHKLFDGLLQLIANSKKDKMSDTPAVFEYKLLVDQ
jgi:hypothetical protein